MHLDPLIIDLAFILILAAVTTIVFKWLKQPVVLGYIVAGYLASDNSTLLPNIHEVVNINSWAEIGIIFLLFGLGLEFSFKKLLNVGGTALTTALIIVAGMMLSGFMTGKMLGWNDTDSVFLGGMLSMSSTTIIIKAFNDLGLKGRRFTTVVFGVLVVEDLFAVIMMVILSSIYVGHNVATESGGAGMAVAWSVVKLLFFLVVWFGVGIALIPSILRRAKRFLSGETLLIISLGLCLGMVVFANSVGFSSALGAFVMGSILAETVEAKDITRITAPIRDLFGAVFFISVGILVDPGVVMEYWLPILIITMIVILGQIIFASLGVLLSGQGLRTAIESGFSLAQIGEFAFIIATLGLTLGVTSSFLYPVAVAVAVITTFTTPFIMKLAPKAFEFIDRRLPDSIKTLIDKYSASGVAEEAVKSNWQRLLGKYIPNLVVLTILLLGVEWLLIAFVLPFISGGMDPGLRRDVVMTVVSLLAIAPFVWGLTMRRIEPDVLMKLWTNSHFNRGLIIALIVLRVFVALCFVMFIMIYIHSYRIGVLTGVLIIGVILALFSRKIQRWWGRFERRFSRNIDSQKGIVRIGRTSNDLHLTHVVVSPDCPLCGRTLSDITIRQLYGVGLVNIKRGSHSIPVPDSREMIMPYDELMVVGPDADLRSFMTLAEQSDEHLSGDSVKDKEQDAKVDISRVWLRSGSPLIGRTVGDSLIRQSFKCMVVWIDRHDGLGVIPLKETQFRIGDVVWIAGLESGLKQFKDKYGNV